MAMILEIITIHLDRKNVTRLKEFESYKENEIDDPCSCTYPPRKTYSKPKTIEVVLSPLKLPPVRTDHENVYAYKVSHEIEWGSNGYGQEAPINLERGYVCRSSYNNGLVWLTEREIGLLTANKDPNYFFELFGEVRKNDN
jgi:hypothetical protein